MKYLRKLLPLVILGLCITNFNADAKPNKSSSNEQVVIEGVSIPEGVKPGDKPITLNKGLLKKLLPELINPRLMTFKDLGTPAEQEGFLEGGYTFVLRGDFDRDGFADIVFVGKYDNPENPERNSFIAVVTIKGEKIIRKYFSKIHRDRISLLRAVNYKTKIEAIGMSYNIASDDCGFLYWTGKDWQFDACQTVF